KITMLLAGTVACTAVLFFSMGPGCSGVSLRIQSPQTTEPYLGCNIDFSAQVSVDPNDVVLKIDDALVEGNGEVDTGSRIISISNFQAGADLIEFKACNFAAGEHTFWGGFDGDGDGNFEGVADSTTEVTFTVDVLQESGYEKVLTLASNGTVTEGNWDDFYNQVVNEGNDCKVRFDGRVIASAHIEYTSSSVTFDFAPLHAYHNGWDSYAYIDLQKGVRAGIGAAYPRGHDDVVWKKDQAQHDHTPWPDEFVAKSADLLCR
ncbi:MAG: hypothetical protein D6812_11025, partial [Deltaproteobacteria bacterium]